MLEKTKKDHAESSTLAFKLTAFFFFLPSNAAFISQFKSSLFMKCMMFSFPSSVKYFYTFFVENCSEQILDIGNLSSMIQAWKNYME